MIVSYHNGFSVIEFYLKKKIGKVISSAGQMKNKDDNIGILT